MVEDDTKLNFEDFAKTDHEIEYDSIVIGYSPTYLDYKHLNLAYQLLLKQPSIQERSKSIGNNQSVIIVVVRIDFDWEKLIAMHKGMKMETESGLSLGPGPFINMLETVTKRKSVIIGKPNKIFFKTGLHSECDADEAVMIGDDINDDVLGAEAVGINGILVQSGKYRNGDELNATNYFTDLYGAIEAILIHNQKSSSE